MAPKARFLLTVGVQEILTLIVHVLLVSTRARHVNVLMDKPAIRIVSIDCMCLGLHRKWAITKTDGNKLFFTN